MATIVTRAGKGSPLTHAEVDANFTNLNNDKAETTALALLAPLASPVLTGVPEAPTASPGTNTTQIATTAFVLANAGGAPGGSTTQLQYNNAGAFGGVSGVKSDGASLLRVSDDSHVVFDKDTRGGAADTVERLATVTDFATPNIGGYVVGQSYDNLGLVASLSTLAMADDRMDLAPFAVNHTHTVDQFRIRHTGTPAAGNRFKIVVYDADAAGWPDNLLLETVSTADLTGFNTTTDVDGQDFQFLMGKKYWVGIRMLGTNPINSMPLSSARSLGVSASNFTQYYTLLRRTVTYANPAPNPWVFTASDLVTNVTPPLVRYSVQSVP